MLLSITPKLKKQLKIQATRLNPVILIGNKGLTEAVQKEIAQALTAHELIKIRFHSKDRAFHKQAVLLICEYHDAALIDSIGHVSVIYRPQQESK
ncbi:MAG TPA: YhbY family RNA-binding protein [Gammaproteobacteria bacterium]|nr:YhbY family RNA-binding protein [Gammaproteobacteria bacterium]